MRNRKIALRFYFFVFVLIGVMLLPSCTAAITNIWGTSTGTSKSYSYQIKYTGGISNTINNGLYTFTIINIWDNDANNYTELLYSRELVVPGNPSDINLLILEDEGANWNYNDLIIIFSGVEIQPLCPTGYNAAPARGMNWTAQINTIQGLTNYTATIDGDTLTIHHWTTGTDGDTGAHYTLDDYIKWDMSTGWLISFEETTDYGDPANFIRTISVKGSSGGLALDITLIIGIIGAICGGIALGFAYYLWKKRR
jgi:hypothetical protein